MGSVQDCVQLLGKNDVLLGRGSIIAGKPGNVQFRKIVEKRKEEYRRSHPHVKSQVAKSVMADLQRLDPPGRFVEERNKGYCLVSLKKALEKTMRALREPTKRGAEGKTNNISSIQIQSTQDNICSSYFAQKLAESHVCANAMYFTYKEPPSPMVFQSGVYASPTFGRTSGITAKTAKVGIPHKRASTKRPLLMSQYDNFCDADESPLDASCSIYFECLLRSRLR